MPGYPGKPQVMEFLARKGYWVFVPRYRGSWESTGEFLKHSPEEDIRDVINAIDKPFKDIWTNKTFSIKHHSLFVIGASFGGAAAILCSRHPKVTKAIAIAPVIDWTADSKTEPLPLLEQLTEQAFGPVYRFKHASWVRLSKGKLYNPITHRDELNPKKLLIIHAKDDDLVPFAPSQLLAKHIGCAFKAYKTGRHLGTSAILKPNVYSIVKNFLSQ